MEELHFESAEEFSKFIDGVATDYIDEGEADFGSSLRELSTAFEVPMTGYYMEIYLLLKTIINNKSIQTTDALNTKTIMAYNACNKILNN